MSSRDTGWLEGVGLHTGAFGRVRVRSAPPGSGLVFRSPERGETIRVGPEAVVDTSRRTVLASDRFRISTVEHLLAACHGLGLWDAEVEVEGPEVPALDGSALPFVRALQPLAGNIAPQGPLRLSRPFRVRLGRATAQASPAPSLTISCRVRFDHPAIGTQRASWRGSRRGFVERLAPARTFGFLTEVEALRRRGLAGGGSLDNALVYDQEGPMVPERLEREPARHKLLDAIGDLALLGRPLAARIVLDEPGHGLTVKLVRMLVSEGGGSDQLPQKSRQRSWP